MHKEGTLMEPDQLEYIKHIQNVKSSISYFDTSGDSLREQKKWVGVTQPWVVYWGTRKKSKHLLSSEFSTRVESRTVPGLGFTISPLLSWVNILWLILLFTTTRVIFGLLKVLKRCLIASLNYWISLVTRSSLIFSPTPSLKITILSGRSLKFFSNSVQALFKNLSKSLLTIS